MFITSLYQYVLNIFIAYLFMAEISYNGSVNLPNFTDFMLSILQRYFPSNTARVTIIATSNVSSNLKIEYDFFYNT